MCKWEHIIEVLLCDDTLESDTLKEEMTMLDYKGERGWELAGVTYDKNGDKTFYFKRQKHL